MSLGITAAGELDGDVAVARLAVTPAQDATLGLPKAITKENDKRPPNGAEGGPQATVQAEAIPPDVLARIVGDAIRNGLDHDAFNRVLAAKDAAKANLKVVWARANLTKNSSGYRATFDSEKLRLDDLEPPAAMAAE